MKKIAVIGGGIAGCVSAFFLARAGHEVVLFEQDKLGAGASGLALGALVPFGPHVKGNIACVQRDSLARWPDLAAELAGLAGVDVGTFYRRHEIGHQLWLPAVFEVFKAALGALGVKVVEGVRMEDGVRNGEEYEGVVWAAGWGVAEQGLLPLTISAGVAVRVALPEQVEVPLTYTGEVYVVSDWDGTVLLGSVSTPMGAPGDGLVRDAEVNWLWERGVAAVPALAKGTIVGRWVGYRPDLRPKLPLVRPVGERVWAVTGLGKIGFCLAHAVGEAVLAQVGPRA